MKTIVLILLIISSLFAELISLDSLYYVPATEKLSSKTIVPHDSSLQLYDGGVIDFIESAGIYTFIHNIPTDWKGKYLLLDPSPYGITLKFNGENIYQWGEGLDTRCMANYRAEAIILPSYLFLESGKNILEIQFVSDGARIAFPGIRIGEYRDVKREEFRVSLLNAVMIKVIVGIAFFSTALLFVYYLLIGGKDEKFLFLCLFSLSLVASYTMFVINSPHFDQVFLFKLARIGGVMMSLTMFLFITSITNLLQKYTYRLIVAAAFVPYVLFILGESTKYGINVVFSAASHTLIFPLLIVGVILMIVSMVKSFRIEVITIFVPYLVLMGAVFSDIGYIIQFRQPLIWKIPYGYLTILMGGMFTVLYSRTRLSGKYKDATELLNGQIERLNIDIYENALTTREFLSDLNGVSHLADVPFSHLLDELTSSEYGDDISQLYSLFMQFNVTIHNMIYLDKIKNGEFYLWYDGFSLKNMFDRRIGFLTWMAEERGVELQFQARSRSFPSLVWGDETAVFQAICNAILVAVEVENELLQIAVRYIPYEGLEVEIKGKESDFAYKFINLVTECKVNKEPFSIAIILKELFRKLDCSISQAAEKHGNDPVIFSIPLKLSEN